MVISKKKRFVYKIKRGAKRKTASFSDEAFHNNPLPLVRIPEAVSLTVTVPCKELYSISVNNLPGNPVLSAAALTELVQLESAECELTQLESEIIIQPVKRKYTKKMLR